jgi:polyhydroxyalkanoate synthase
MVGGRKVDLREVAMPVLNIYSETDHIIPAPSSRALRSLVGTGDYAEASVKGGHIGILVARSQERLREEIAGWLAAR